MAVDALDAIKQLESNIFSVFDELECRHAIERIALSKMQHGRNMALASMYPGLHAFDSDIPEPKGHVNEHKEEPAQSVDDDDDDEDVDKPIYYKIDSFQRA